MGAFVTPATPVPLTGLMALFGLGGAGALICCSGPAQPR